jgi:mRNA interferase YafQ
MLQVEYTARFKRDLKLAKRRNKDLSQLQEVMKLIVHERPLSQRLKDHALTGNWVGYRELHLQPDWLLIYKLLPIKRVVIFVRTGTHSDLFA